MSSANDMVDGQLCGLLMGGIGVPTASMARIEEVRAVNYLESRYELGAWYSRTESWEIRSQLIWKPFNLS